MKFDFIPSTIYINQQAIYQNVKYFQHLHPQKKIWAVVKADAYGHGVHNVCSPALAAGANGFCVAYVDEALVLRKMGVDTLILVLGASLPESVSVAQKEGISLTAPSFDWLQKSLKYLDPNCLKRLKVHIALDTGMGRIGFTNLAELKRAINFINQHQEIFELEGLFTHFATADENDVYYQHQEAKFKELIAQINEPVKYLHCENSAAGLLEPEDNFTNTIRLGIGMYGVSPLNFSSDLATHLHPVMSLKSKISFIKKIKKGSKISYGATYTAPKDEWIATVSIGYADGWLRRLQGFKVLVDGQYCSNVGRITMDQLMIKVPRHYPIGTPVTFLGKDGTQEITATEIADYAQTIPYEIFTSFSKRLPRVAINLIN